MGAKVLIVEDNLPIQKIYVTLLSMEGFEVATARDGHEALAVAERDPPDLILLDLLMPHLDGIGFLREYRPRARTPPVRVIVFSNSEVPEKVQEAMRLGAWRYLTKYSVTPKTIVGLIRDALAQPA